MHLHTLRHSAASALIASGAHLKVVQELQNHVAGRAVAAATGREDGGAARSAGRTRAVRPGEAWPSINTRGGLVSQAKDVMTWLPP